MENAEINKPRLLILGAGIFQLEAIRLARASGCYVITADNQPGSPGHQLANESVNCSTTQVQDMLRIARQLGIDGIFSMASDIAMPTIAHVAYELGLPGPPVATTEIMTRKDRFRAFQSEHGLNGPNYMAARRFEDVDTTIFDAGSTVVVKPVATSGSRGISACEPSNRASLQESFRYAAQFTSDGWVCLESWVEGESTTAEGMVRNGQLAAFYLTRKFEDSFRVLGHRLPSGFPEATRRAAKDAVVTHLRALGYTDGPFDADLRVDGNRATVIEIAPRLGGNGVPVIAGQFMGRNLIGEAIDLSIGRWQATGELPSCHCGVSLITSKRSGKIKSVANANQIKKADSRIIDIKLAARCGTPVAAFKHGGNVLGYAVFKCNDDSEYLDATRSVERHLALNVV